MSEFVKVSVTIPALTVAGNSSAFFLPSAVASIAKAAGLAAAVDFSSSSPQPATSAPAAMAATSARVE